MFHRMDQVGQGTIPTRRPPGWVRPGGTEPEVTGAAPRRLRQSGNGTVQASASLNVGRTSVRRILAWPAENEGSTICVIGHKPALRAIVREVQPAPQMPAFSQKNTNVSLPAVDPAPPFRRPLALAAHIERRTCAALRRLHDPPFSRR